MANAQLLEGSPLAERILVKLARDIQKLDTKPTMVALSVGEHTASQVYLNSQKKIAAKLGINHTVQHCDSSVTDEQLIDHIHRLNDDKTVQGIIIQMPLPEHITIGKILDAINPEKDIEGVHPYNLGKLVLKKSMMPPCTAQAVMELINATGVDLYGAEVVVVGSGKVVGRPLSLLLMEKMATTTICNIATSEKKQLERHVRHADVLIAAAGKAGLIKGAWIKDGSVVIDVGINHVEGKVVGDVEFDVAVKRAAYITPVPGGVGPLTVTILMTNVLTAFKLQSASS